MWTLNYVKLLFVDYSSAFNTIVPSRPSITPSWRIVWTWFRSKGLNSVPQLWRFWVSSMNIKAFYSGTVKSIVTQNLTSRLGNGCVQDCKILHKGICAMKQCCRSDLLSQQDFYNKRYRTRATRIFIDWSHPNNRLFQLLKSEKRSIIARKERLTRGIYPQAIRLLN